MVFFFSFLKSSNDNSHKQCKPMGLDCLHYERGVTRHKHKHAYKQNKSYDIILSFRINLDCRLIGFQNVSSWTNVECAPTSDFVKIICSSYKNKQL